MANRRSNRIAIQQQQSLLLSLTDHNEPNDAHTDNINKPARYRQRHTKLKTTHVATTSSSSIGKSILSLELANCLVLASDIIAQGCQWNSGGCFLICHECKFATVRLDFYITHVATVCSRAASAQPLQVYRCPHCPSASESHSWVTSHAALMSEHLALAHSAEIIGDDPTHQTSNAGPAVEVAVGLASPSPRVNRRPALRPATPAVGSWGGGRGRPHACSDCGKRFGMRYSLMRHRLTVHEAPGTAAGAAGAAAKPRRGRSKLPSASAGAATLACRLCSKLFKSRRSYLVHRLAFHPADGAAVADAATTAAAVSPTAEDANCLLVTDPEPFKCRYCELKFAQKTVFLRHQARDHPGERPFTCGECGRGFKFQHSLAMHERLHKGELTCQQCSRVFHSDREYNEHQASVHEGSVTFLCESCGRTFPTQYKLSRHGRVHNRSRQHACPQCGRHFHRMDKLKLHLQCVHSTDRPHLCHLCGRAFNRRDKLAEHVKQHSVHQCPTCSAAFSSRADLRRHTAAEHRGDQQKRRPERRRAKASSSTTAPGASTAATQPPQQPLLQPPPQPPPSTSPLGDALITITNGLEIHHHHHHQHHHQQQQQQQSQQIIFLESFDQPPHLTLYSPVSGAYYTTIANNSSSSISGTGGIVSLGASDTAITTMAAVNPVDVSLADHALQQ